MLILTMTVFAVAFHLFIQEKSKIEVGIYEIDNIHMTVEGVWKVIRSPGHDTFAFDLTRIDKTSHKKLVKSRVQHLLGNTKAEDWYSWNEVVYSPTEGVIVQSNDSEADRKHQTLLKDLWDIIKFFNLDYSRK